MNKLSPASRQDFLLYGPDDINLSTERCSLAGDRGHLIFGIENYGFKLLYKCLNSCRKCLCNSLATIIARETRVTVGN